MTTSSAASDENLVKMIKFSFQCASDDTVTDLCMDYLAKKC